MGKKGGIKKKKTGYVCNSCRRKRKKSGNESTVEKDESTAKEQFHS